MAKSSQTSKRPVDREIGVFPSASVANCYMRVMGVVEHLELIAGPGISTALVRAVRGIGLSVWYGSGLASTSSGYR
jgi:hypothetical protein